MCCPPRIARIGVYYLSFFKPRIGHGSTKRILFFDVTFSLVLMFCRYLRQHDVSHYKKQKRKKFLFCSLIMMFCRYLWQHDVSHYKTQSALRGATGWLTIPAGTHTHAHGSQLRQLRTHTHKQAHGAQFYSGSYPPNCWRGIFTLVPNTKRDTELAKKRH